MDIQYKNIETGNWVKITETLLKYHPLQEKSIVEIVLKSWKQIFTSKIGPFSIGKELFPTPQIMSFLLHELVAHNLSLLYPGKWRVGKEKNEKDLVCIENDEYSVEIKASSHKDQVFGNRSYAQQGKGNNYKDKSGYYILINFEKFSDNINPEILLIRFGYIEHSDWIGQKSPTGQQARISSDAYLYKLKTIFSKLSGK